LAAAPIERGARVLDVSIANVPRVWRVRATDALFDAILDGAVRAAASLRARRLEALTAMGDAVGLRLEPVRAGQGYDVPMPARVLPATEPG
jgi:hypothetical protein